MQSAENAAGLRFPSRWALLQERLLAPICGHTMSESSTHITFSRLEPISLYVLSPVFFLQSNSRQSGSQLAGCLLEDSAIH